MSEQRMHARPGSEDLGRAHAPGRGIAATRGADITPDLCGDAADEP